MMEARTRSKSDVTSFTKAELNAMLDEAEARFEAGLGIPDEDAWDDLEEELALQEEEQHEMAKML